MATTASTAGTNAVPAVEGWFDSGEPPALLGSRCTTCATVAFPPTSGFCRNPVCRGREVEQVRLSRTGTIWSYTDAQYQPPPPFIPAGEAHEPFAIAAVELAEEALVVLGQVSRGVGVEDLAVGATVELVIEPMYVDEDGTERTIWRWRPVAGSGSPSDRRAASDGSAG